MKMRRLLQALSLLLLLSCCHANLNSGSGVFKFIKYLNHPPEITVRPRPQVVRAGGVAFFLCAAKGDPPPLLRWRRRSRSGAAAAAALTERAKVLRLPGPPGPPVGGKVASAAAGGARLLRIQNVQPRDGAIFVCVAENSAGDAVSAEAQLTVLDGKGLPGFPVVSPAISDSLTSRVVEAGHSVVLPCSATGNPLPTIAWLKDGVPLQALHKLGGRVAVINAPGPSGSLNVSAAKESDQGRYECVAENTVGSQFSAPIQLYVKVRRVQPYFTLPAPAEVEVQIGAHINLTCAASGTPMPRLRWHLSKDYAMLNDRRMDWPMADQPQEDQDYQDEEDNELLLVPEHVPMNTEEQETSTHRPDRADGTLGAASVVLNNIKENLNYTCVATSALGVIHSTTRIRVQTLPGPPLALRAYDVTATSARLSWRSPADEPREYALQFRVKGSAAARGFTKGSGVGVAGGIFQEVKGVSSLHYTLRGLTANTKYEVRVVAVNALGRGPHSEPLAFTTLHAEDSPFDVPQTEEAPRGLQVRPLSSTTLLVQWDEPPSPSGPVSGYRVYFTTHPLLPLPLWSQQSVDDSRLSTVSGLTPHQVYWVRVQALTAVGAGPPSVPALVKTQQGVPGSPNKFRLASVSSSWARLEWSPPSPLAEDIVSYELYWNDTYSRERHHLSLSPGSRGALLETLYPGSMYVAWVAARSPRGEGAPTTPLAVRTQPLVLPAPKDIKTWPINTTAIRLEWKPPTAGANLTRGFVVLLESNQEDAVPVEVEVPATQTQAEVGALQPDTEYAVRVAALVRDTRGTLSAPDAVRTRGGVPARGRIHARFLARSSTVPTTTAPSAGKRSPAPPLEVTWLMPPQSATPVIGYRLLYGPVGDPAPKELLKNAADQRAILDDLERGVQYEFRMAGRTQAGWGQDARLTMWMPEGRPSGPPTNVTVYWQAAGVLAVTWDPPETLERGGNVTVYTASVTKAGDYSGSSPTVIFARNVSAINPKAVFAGLEDGVDVDVQVQAHTSQGAGPASPKLTVRVPPSPARAPLKVGAAATSQHSMEVWWEPLPVRGKLLGYQVLYTTTAVEDLDEWQSLSVGLTESVELVGLERLAEYAVTVAARTREGLGHLSSALTVRVRPTEVPVDLRASDVSTHGLTLKWGPAIQINPLHYRLSWDAVKLFVDAQGITQTQLMPRRDLQLDKAQRMYQLTQLQPFTTYRVNLTAVPADRAYRPPATLIVTTQMAAPQPMVQPALYGVVFGKEIQVILPQASEQYGPISHYYLVVVPEPMPVVEAPERPDRQDAPPVPVPAYSPPIPDTLLTSHLERASLEEREAPLRPYIAASFPQRNIPYTFHLGNNETYDGFRNKPLRSTARYRIFIRAVVDTPQKHLYTSSPYSEPLSLSMRAVPPGAAPRRPDPSVPVERQGGVAVRGGARARLGSPGLMWLVGPLGAALLLCILMVALYVVRRKRRPAKAPDAEPDGPATRPLIANQGVDGQASVSHAHSPVASDPVRVRRQNCQTAAMQAHPPVPVASLAEHMRALRDAGGISQEYESIEPGQTFTWDHSSLEVNRGKNRYANVVAYDHSRVVLNGDEPGADYINANFCDGYRQRDAYVATQGPMPNTFADFWRMVWQLGATTIAMVTRLEERTRVKCHQYWPERGSEQYGQCQVTAVLHQELAHYTLRTFSIRQARGLPAAGGASPAVHVVAGPRRAPVPRPLPALPAPPARAAAAGLGRGAAAAGGALQRGGGPHRLPHRGGRHAGADAAREHGGRVRPRHLPALAAELHGADRGAVLFHPRRAAGGGAVRPLGGAGQGPADQAGGPRDPRARPGRHAGHAHGPRVQAPQRHAAAGRHFLVGLDGGEPGQEPPRARRAVRPRARHPERHGRRARRRLHQRLLPGRLPLPQRLHRDAGPAAQHRVPVLAHGVAAQRGHHRDAHQAQGAGPGQVHAVLAGRARAALRRRAGGAPGRVQPAHVHAARVQGERRRRVPHHPPVPPERLAGRRPHRLHRPGAQDQAAVRPGRPHHRALQWRRGPQRRVHRAGLAAGAHAVRGHGGRPRHRAPAALAAPLHGQHAGAIPPAVPVFTAVPGLLRPLRVVKANSTHLRKAEKKLKKLDCQCGNVACRGTRGVRLVV